MWKIVFVDVASIARGLLSTRASRRLSSRVIAPHRSSPTPRVFLRFRRYNETKFNLTDVAYYRRLGVLTWACLTAHRNWSTETGAPSAWNIQIALFFCRAFVIWCCMWYILRICAGVVSAWSPYPVLPCKLYVIGKHAIRTHDETNNKTYRNNTTASAT